MSIINTNKYFIVIIIIVIAINNAIINLYYYCYCYYYCYYYYYYCYEYYVAAREGWAWRRARGSARRGLAQDPGLLQTARACEPRHMR